MLQQLPRLVRLRFNLTAEDPIELPVYAGSALRGLLGHGLKRTVCVTREPTCDRCMLRSACVYSLFFETPADRANANRYNYLPHPFVIWVDQPGNRQLNPGDGFALEMCLIGEADRYLPYLVHALGKAGERGLGRGDGGRFRLDSLDQEIEPGQKEWHCIHRAGGPLTQLPGRLPVVPNCSGDLQIQLLTPLRLKRRGRLLTPERFSFGDFLWALRERLSLLQGKTGESSGSIKEQLPDSLLSVSCHSEQLRWKDWTRYSSRQRTRMQMGGLTGTIRIDGGLPQEWMPLIQYGQWVHLGKATSMGLGRYRLTADSGEPAPL